MPRYTHQACNIEELIQISPYAVICLFRFTLSLLMGLLQWTPYVSTKVLLGVCVYIAGLTVLEKKPTQSKIARTLGNVSHDALNRLAKPVNELYQQIVVGIILLIEAVSGEGYLILDDVILPKPFCRYVAGAYMDYDSAQRRHIKCQRLVVLLWSNRFISIPVAFAFWHHRDFVKTYRTKNEIARILIYWTVCHGIGFSYLTFDNGYASKQNLRFFNRLGLRFVTRLRKNTWIIHEGKKKKVTDLNSYECHRYSALKAYVRQFDVDYPRFGTGSLALVKHDKLAEPGRTKYLFTNDLSLTNQELVGRYRSRWEIEIFFRTCKQSFALSACQAQKMPQVILHIRMVLLAYTLTQLLIGDGSMSIEQMQTYLRSLHWQKLPDQPALLVCMQADGTLIPVSLETLMEPIGTRLSELQHVQTPTIPEFMTAA